MKTKIFCDIAEIDIIKKFNKKKLVKGFTTNPSLMRKAGAKNYKTYSQKILKICNNKPVSLEVFGDNYKDMKKQALKINTWGKNVYVKVPVTNSKGVFMGKIIKELNAQKIKLNITAIYSAKQTSKILKFFCHCYTFFKFWNRILTSITRSTCKYRNYYFCFFIN